MKDLLRKQVLAARGKMSEAEVANKSHKAFALLKECTFFASADHIMAYLDFKNEVRTDAIINYSLMHNKSVYIPVCIPETHELCVSRITTFDDLQAGHYGIREPKLQALRLAESGLIDLVLVPGVAFDASGNRIGYGAGYYDRFMKRLRPGAVKVALAYSFQLSEGIPPGEFDIPVDYIVTEEAVIKCSLNA